jgi:hypothetical protein
MDMDAKSIEYISKEIEKILDENNVDFDMEKLIRLRYGIGISKPMKFKELVKEFKVHPKKLKEKIIYADKKVYNLLKNKI